MDDSLWKDQVQKMVVTFILKLMFIFWALTVAALSVISYPGGKDLLMSVKVTDSGFVVHGIAYFVGMLLFFLAYEKTGVRSQKSGARERKDIGRRSEVSFVLWAGLLIFFFSVVLEVVQFYLPCRTFNVYDVVANGVGILSFVFIWLILREEYGAFLNGTR